MSAGVTTRHPVRLVSLVGRRVLLWGRYLAEVEDEHGDRLLVKWYHPEDGYQLTWVDASEVTSW